MRHAWIAALPLALGTLWAQTPGQAARATPERPGIRAWNPPSAREREPLGEDGDTCGGDRPGTICLAVRYLSFQEDNGAVVAPRSLAQEHIRRVNALWSQCGIGFRLESYGTINPHDYGLHFGRRSERETYELRRKFSRSSSLLVMTTGDWVSDAVAWTEPPGKETHGAILSGAVAGDAEILAHELGHYLGLDHPVEAPREARANLLNWRVYPDSHALTLKQCQAATQSVTRYWRAMRR